MKIGNTCKSGRVPNPDCSSFTVLVSEIRIFNQVVELAARSEPKFYTRVVASRWKITHGLKVNYDWWKLYYKKFGKNFLNAIQKISPEKSLSLLRNRKKNENMLLIYDVNNHVFYSKSKSVKTLYGFGQS